MSATTMLPQDATMTGSQKVLACIDVRHSVGLEIGPLTRPIVSKTDGTIFYVDRATTEELKRDFRGSGSHIEADKIVDVDYVWGKNTLAQCVGARRFDYCVASHVIEHIPDVLTWLGEIADVLKPNGILSLIVPDRRYTFDFLRPPSTLADVLDAHMRRLRQPSFGQVFDHFANYAEVDAAQMWTSEAYRDHVKPALPLARALAAAQESQGRYIDAHCWVFTPQTFLTLIDQLQGLGFLRFRIERFFEPVPGTNEFFVTLRL